MSQRQNLPLLLFFSVVLHATALFPSVAEALIRVDRTWVKARAQEICVPDNANQPWNCQPQFDACQSEFVRMMEGTFFTFCRGTNPEICNMVGHDIYEFSNKGYGDFVVNPSDRFLFTDPSVKAAYACVSQKPQTELIVAQPLNVLREANRPADLLFREQPQAVLKVIDRLPPDPEPAPVAAPPPPPPPAEAAAPAEPPAPEEAPPRLAAEPPIEAPPAAAPEPVDAAPPSNPSQENAEVAAVVAAAEGVSAGTAPSSSGWTCNLRSPSTFEVSEGRSGIFFFLTVFVLFRARAKGLSPEGRCAKN